MSKIRYGQFFTEKNIFKNNNVFKNFMSKNNLWNSRILEPFAGSNNLIKFLQEFNNDLKYVSYDIEPRSSDVIKNDSLNNWIYDNFDLLVTNPPYLSKHSSKKKKINVDFGVFDDLYKLSIYKCILNVRFVIAIIPSSFIYSNRKEDKKLLEKLLIFQFLPDKNNFLDTEHPVALAYFDNNKLNEINFKIYENSNFIDYYQNLLEKQEKILTKNSTQNINFNNKNGNICMSTSDNSKDKCNIKFYDSSLMEPNYVKKSNRHRVKILIKNVEINNNLINELNSKILELRVNKCDYLWTPFKGVSKNGHFRRRISFNIVRKIINSLKIS